MDLISEFLDGYRYIGFWSSPIGYGKQYRVKNREDVIRYLKIFNGVLNCGISISTYINDTPYLLYLPLDFDSSDLRLAWEDAKLLYNELVNDGIDVSINYSGFRGFHILISTVPKPYTRPQIRASQKFFKRFFNLDTCDKQIFGDIRRLIRIPGTLHAGKFRKDDNNKWQFISEGAYAKVIAYNKGEPLDLDEIVEDSVDEGFPISLDRKNIHPYPCIERHINNEEPQHIVRYSYIAYLLETGMTPDEIVSHLKTNHGIGAKYEWIDWDEEYTINQVYHIANGTYHPLRCSTLKELGYCIEDCPYNVKTWNFKKVNEL